MPPRRSARLLAAAEERVSSVLPPLPPALALAILALLPLKARARAACVSRAWRSAADASEAWTTLDLRPYSSLGAEKYSALLRGAAAKARGRLVSLDVRGNQGGLRAALRSVVAANGGSLRELWLGLHWNSNELTVLLTSAPALRALHAGVLAEPDAAAALLSEPRFRVRQLCIDFSRHRTPPPLAALAALLRHCATLKRLRLHRFSVGDAAPLRELLDAAAAARLPALDLAFCRLPNDAPDALAALLRGGTLARLYVTGPDEPLLRDAHAAAPLCDALRGCATITTLRFVAVRLFLNVDAGLALLAAITGHASIRRLRLWSNPFEDGDGADAISGALAALVAANAPSLTDLDLDNTVRSDRAAAPLLRALRANTHLRGLGLIRNDFSAAFINDELLDALRENASLERLRLDRSKAEQRAAEDFVAHRAAARRRGDAAPIEERETDDEW